MPVRRKLKENWAEFLTKWFEGSEKMVDAVLWVLQLFHMCEVAAGFAGKNKSFRCFADPGFHAFLIRKAIETVIEFHCMKCFRIGGQHVLTGYIGWIKRAYPMTKIPARCADMNVFRRHGYPPAPH